MVIEEYINNKKTRPTSVGALQQIIKDAFDTEHRVAILGKGAYIFAAPKLVEQDIFIELSALNRVLEFNPDDMTVTVECGITLDQLNGVLNEKGKWFPYDGPGEHVHTIGGLLATGWAGGCRIRYGAPRDNLLGIKVVLPNGDLISSGGKVVKNVSGYDLHRFFVGSWGSFGAIAQATFKVYPVPKNSVHGGLTSDDYGLIKARLKKAISYTSGVAALVVHKVKDTYTLHIRVDGTYLAVNRVIKDLDLVELQELDWNAILQRNSSWVKIVLLPGIEIEVLQEISCPTVTEAVVLGGCGAIHAFGDIGHEEIVALANVAKKHSGYLEILHARPEILNSFGRIIPPPSGLELISSIKKTFDPKGIFPELRV